MNAPNLDPNTLLVHLLVGEVRQPDISYFNALGHSALQLSDNAIVVHQPIHNHNSGVLDNWPTYISTFKNRLPLPHDDLAKELTVSYEYPVGKWEACTGSFGVPNLYTQFEHGKQLDVVPASNIDAAVRSLYLHIQQLRQAR